MADPGPNQMITCPYNKAHQVEQYRMHIHLQKCRKQHLNCNKVTCLFDSTHIINDVELDYHVTVCPKRQLLDRQIYVMDNDYCPTVEVQASSSEVNCEEDWETGTTTSYIPDQTKKGGHIIMKVKGATPSERRKVRMQGIAKYKSIE